MRTLFVCTILVLCCLAINCGIGGHYVQQTDSMSPTIGVGDHFTTIELKSESFNPIERFDVAIYKPQASKIKGKIEENVKFVHRIIGLPNEKIEIKDGKIFINDKLLDEPFEIIVGGRDFLPITIPENEYFLLGDNRPNSFDSRFWDKPTINKEDIFGKVNTIIHKDDWDKGKRW